MTKPLLKLGTDFVYNPHPVYDELRKQGPIHHVLLPNGLPSWLVVDYQLAREVLADGRIKKGAAALGPITARLRSGDFYAAVSSDLWEHMLSSDPPDHTRLRRLVAKGFTSRTVEQLHPRIDALADRLLDDMAGKSEVDLIDGYALPIPMTVICELFGVPEVDRARFRELSTTMTASSAENAEDPQAAANSSFYVTAAERSAASIELATYLIGLVAERSKNLGEDLLSQLITANHEGDKLSDKELIAMLFLILVAGHETTVNLIGNGLYAMLRERVLYEDLTRSPERIPAAIEEFLRHEGPVHLATLRYTSEPVTLAGIDIPAEELVSVSLAAADRDPSQFENPHAIEIGKAGQSKGGHLAFGHGIHYCVGAPLARLEAKVAFEKILARYPNMKMADEVQWRPSTFLRGLQTLPTVID